MSLLGICQDAASQLGLAQPSAIVGSTGLTEQVLLRHAQAAGKQLMKYHDWQVLTTELAFTTVAAEIQTTGLASDYDRMLFNPEVWNRSLNIRYSGPTPQRTWQRLKSSGITTAVGGYWRLMGGSFQLYPAPTAGETVAYEYISKNFCTDSGGNGQALWMADTDVALIPEDLFTLEIVWRFRQGRGFAQYAEDLETCEREKEKAASRDRGTGRIRPPASNVPWPPVPQWTGEVTP